MPSTTAAVLLLALAAAPARAAMVGMGAAASRAAVRAQMPVLLNQFFAQPNPSTRAQLLTGLSLSGNDRFINSAVRLSVAQNLASLDVSVSRAANMPGAADPGNEHAQGVLTQVAEYRAFVLETLQLPHVAQHLTKAQRADVAARAADADVALTPEKADALILRAQEEVEKLLAGQREHEEGFATDAQGETPRSPRLGRRLPSEPSARARAAIPSPAALAKIEKRDAALRRANRLSFIGGALNIGAAAVALLFSAKLAALLAAPAVLLGAAALLNALPGARGFGAALSRPAALLSWLVPLTVTAALLHVYAAPGVFDAFSAVTMSAFTIGAVHDGRRTMGLIFAGSAGWALHSALSLLVPGIGAASFAAGALLAVLLQAAGVLFARHKLVPDGAAPASGRGWASVAALAASHVARMLGLLAAGGGSFGLWSVLQHPVTGFGLLGVAGAPILAFAVIVAGSALLAYGAPALRDASERLRRD